MGSEKLSRNAPVLKIKTLKTGRLRLTLDIPLENVDLDVIDPKVLDSIVENCNKAGVPFTDIFKTVGNLIVGEGRSSSFIKINRTRPFDPVRFMDHPGLKIGEQDGRSIVLEKIDPSDICLESMLQGEAVIGGEEHLKRLKQLGHIRLDAKIFQTLWENQHLIPERWKGPPNNPKHIFFDGTVLESQQERYVICVYWDKDEEWKWTYCRLDIGGWNADDLSAVLKVS